LTMLGNSNVELHYAYNGQVLFPTVPFQDQ
jgi:hypothetical protein